MKYYIILSFLLLSCSKKMQYSFSPFVTEEIRKCTSEMAKISPKGNYMQIYNDNENLQLKISSIQRGTNFFNSIVKKTNRYAKIGGKKIPIIFLSDMQVSSLSNFDKQFFYAGGIVLEIDTTTNTVVNKAFIM